MLKRFQYFLFVGFFAVISSSLLSAQDTFVTFKYISPQPGSKYIMPGNNIALRHGEPLNPSTLHRNLISVRHQRGDTVSGRVSLSDDGKTFLFLPDAPFELGETVQVNFYAGLETISGKKLKPISFWFTITSHRILIDESYVEKHFQQEPLPLFQVQNPTVSNLRAVKTNNLPEDYGGAEVLINNHPPEGKYFFCPFNQWNWFPGIEPYITITDVFGIPVFYRRIETIASDLKLHSNGQLSFYAYAPIWRHQMLDSSYRFTEDWYKMANGYWYTDFHEFRLLDNGHAFVMTFDPQIVDMSQLVPGGDTAATVSGFVFQELDTGKNVVFQWRSWDHYQITETGDEVDLAANQIDYVHGNAIDVYNDTSIIISSRNFHEITCINWNSGDIIWRLGGKMNMFDFGDDTLRFSRQHFCRRIANGHVIAFDNGTKRPPPQFSSAVEYQIDEGNMTATLVHRYRNNPDHYGFVMGDAQWTPDGTIVMGWGSAIPAITEYDSSENVLYELKTQGINYRAYRFPWKTNYFTFESDSLNMSYVWQYDSIVKKIKVINPQDSDIEITSDYTMTNHFQLVESFPLILPAESEIVVHVKFTPDSVGHFWDILTLNADINTDTLVERIAQQVYVEGFSTQGQSVKENLFGSVLIYPNPAQSVLNVDVSHVDGFSATIVNAMGEGIQSNLPIYDGHNPINVSGIPPGFYSLRLIENSTGAFMDFKWIRR